MSWQGLGPNGIQGDSAEAKESLPAGWWMGKSETYKEKTIGNSQELYQRASGSWKCEIIILWSLEVAGQNGPKCCPFAIRRCCQQVWGTPTRSRRPNCKRRPSINTSLWWIAPNPPAKLSHKPPWKGTGSHYRFLAQPPLCSIAHACRKTALFICTPMTRRCHLHFLPPPRQDLDHSHGTQPFLSPQN